MKNCELKQNEHFLLGSSEAIKNLSEKEEARLLVVSDTHRNTDVLTEILNQYGKSCDALIFCGDGIYDIVSILNNAERHNKFKNIPPVIAFARGNGDPGEYICDFDPTPDNINSSKNFFHLIVPEVQTLDAAGKRIMITHGHIQGIDYGDEMIFTEARAENAEIIMHGHTHFPRAIFYNGVQIINPGSTSRPRGGSPASFAITTIRKNIVDTAFIKVFSRELFTPLS